MLTGARVFHLRNIKNPKRGKINNSERRRLGRKLEPKERKNVRRRTCLGMLVHPRRAKAMWSRRYVKG